MPSFLVGEWKGRHSLTYKTLAHWMSLPGGNGEGALCYGGSRSTPAEAWRCKALSLSLMMNFQVYERGWQEMRLRMCQRLFSY